MTSYEESFSNICIYLFFSYSECLTNLVLSQQIIYSLFTEMHQMQYQIRGQMISASTQLMCVVKLFFLFVF